MGNSSSHSETNSGREIEVTSEEIYFNQISKSNDFITKSKFMETFRQSPFLSELIWKHYSSDPESMNFDDFRNFLNQWDSFGDKLTLFTGLVETTFLNEEDVETLFTWFSMTSVNSDLIVQSLKSAFISYIGSNDSKQYSKEDFLLWTRRNLPDIAHDLHISLLQTVYKGFTVKPPTELKKLIPAMDDYPGLLNVSTLFLMSACIPDSFKKCRHDDQGNINHFELQKLGHLMKLFDSKINGFSSSKLRENVLDYPGHVILLLKAGVHVLCILSDEGLKESFNSYGGVDSRLFLLLPNFSKYVSGKSASAGKKASGIIYSHFTSKSGKHGILVGHDPLANPVLEIDEGMTQIKFLGAQYKIEEIEVWAAGNPQLLQRHNDVKSWEKKEVEKNKNRKLKSDWEDSPDRHILTMGGVQVNHSEAVGGKEPDKNGSSAVPSQ